MAAARSSSVFLPFAQLQYELKSHILSFVADAPLEKNNCPRATLTHTLPFVCKEFHAFAHHDDIWAEVLLRRIDKESIWLNGLEKLCNEGMTPNQGTPAMTLSQLIYFAQSLLHISVKDYIRFKAPVFVMTSTLQLGQPYALHFFEHRYRILIAEVMHHQPLSAKQGGAIDYSLPLPDFLHANVMPLAPTTPAVIVRVMRCEIFPDGQADVLLVPISYVWLERIRVRPNTRHLYEATSIRMGKEVMQPMFPGAATHATAFFVTAYGDPGQHIDLDVDDDEYDDVSDEDDESDEA
jgi:hypothetical protein